MTSLRSRLLVGMIAAVALLLVVGAAQAALLSRLPASNEIRGWAIIAGGDRVAVDSQGLYSLYDGAAPSMRQVGIASAAQRVYRRDAKRLSIDVYKFATPAQAKVFYMARRAGITHSKAFWAAASPTSGRARAITGRTYVAYLWQKQLCCMMSVNGTTEAEKLALEAFSTAISKKIAAQP